MLILKHSAEKHLKKVDPYLMRAQVVIKLYDSLLIRVRHQRISDNLPARQKLAYMEFLLKYMRKKQAFQAILDRLEVSGNLRFLDEDIY